MSSNYPEEHLIEQLSFVGGPCWYEKEHSPSNEHVRWPQEVLGFKTRWCPLKSQHDWVHCEYAHTYQDFRRTPLMGYGPRLCPDWSSTQDTRDYLKRCPRNFMCPYSHGPKEHLYHPRTFKVHPCADFKKTKMCSRFSVCAFYHGFEEKRSCFPSEVDYTQALGMLQVEILKEAEPNYMSQPAFVKDPSECTPHPVKARSHPKREAKRRKDVPKAPANQAGLLSDRTSLLDKFVKVPETSRLAEKSLEKASFPGQNNDGNAFETFHEDVVPQPRISRDREMKSINSGREFCVDDLWPRVHFTATGLNESRGLLDTLLNRWSRDGSGRVYIAAPRGLVYTENLSANTYLLGFPPKGSIEGPALVVVFHPSYSRKTDLGQLFCDVRDIIVVIIDAKHPLPPRHLNVGEPPAFTGELKRSLPLSGPTPSDSKNLNLITLSKSSVVFTSRHPNSSNGKRKDSWDIAQWKSLFPSDELDFASWCRSIGCSEFSCEFSLPTVGCAQLHPEAVDPHQTEQAMHDIFVGFSSNLEAWRTNTEVRPFESNVNQNVEGGRKEKESRPSPLDRSHGQSGTDGSHSSSENCSKYMAIFVGQDRIDEVPFCQWWLLAKGKAFPTGFFSLSARGSVDRSEQDAYEARLMTVLKEERTLGHSVFKRGSSSGSSRDSSDFLSFKGPLDHTDVSLLRKLSLVLHAVASSAPSFLPTPADIMVSKDGRDMAVVIPAAWLGASQFPGSGQPSCSLLKLLFLYVLSEGRLDHLPKQDRQPFSMKTDLTACACSGESSSEQRGARMDLKGTCARAKKRVSNEQPSFKAKDRDSSQGRWSENNRSATKEASTGAGGSQSKRYSADAQEKERFGARVGSVLKDCPPVFDEAQELLESAVRDTAASVQLGRLLDAQPLLKNLLSSKGNIYQKLAHPFFWSPRTQLQFFKVAVKQKAARAELAESACGTWRDCELSQAIRGSLELLHYSQPGYWSSLRFVDWLEDLEEHWVLLCKLNINCALSLFKSRFFPPFEGSRDRLLAFQLHSLAPELLLDIFLDVRADLEGDCRYFFESDDMRDVRRAFDCADIFWK